MPSSRTARQRGRAVPPRRGRRWLGFVVSLVAVPVTIGIVLASRGSVGTIDGVTTFTDLVREHSDEPQTYAQTPPVGGVHNARWQTCGIYTQFVPAENAVHSMEHGAVWITYQPNLSSDEVEHLRDLARGQGYVLLSPQDDLPSPIVASAWGVQMTAEQANDRRLAQFIRRYVQGPQTPEPRAPCYGGVGRPDA